VLEERWLLTFGVLVKRLLWTLLLGMLTRGLPAAPLPNAAARTAPAAAAPVILVFGDSISAAYGLRAGQGWVSLLEQRLKTQGYGYQVVNASVSGETTAGGLSRLPRALKVHRPAVVILELGGNDGLRALPVAQMRSNLMRMVTISEQAKARVLLVGMRMPPNYGAKYTAQFHGVYDDVARYFKIPMVPFLLDEVALKADLMQSDGIHPNVAGQPKLLDNIWPQLQTLLKK
jgi:acyl-CoA thioesterase I